MKMLSLDDAIKAVMMLLNCETDTDKVWSCDVINNLQNAPSVTDVEPTQKWISVKDRLPELTWQAESDDFLIDYSEYVVVLSEGRNRSPKIGSYVREGLRERWEDKDYDPIHDVTHWMPLPEPPKRGKE